MELVTEKNGGGGWMAREGLINGDKVIVRLE
jgi:hypothetical protein